MSTLHRMPELNQGDPLAAFAQAFVAQSVGYFAVVGLVFLVVWKLAARRLAARRIQAVKRFDRRQLWHELKFTLATMAIGTLSAVVIAVFQARGLSRLTTNVDDAGGWVVIVASVVGLILFNDAWFYWCHRALHTPRLFRWVHAVHHKSVDTNPFTSYSFHPLEGWLLGAWTIPFVLLVPFYAPALGVLQGIGLANNVMAHLGYELLPRGWLRIPVLRWSNTATFHNLHHLRLQGNYGLFTRLWDRACGTELPEYEHVFGTAGTEAHATRVSGGADGAAR